MPWRLEAIEVLGDEFQRLLVAGRDTESGFDNDESSDGRDEHRYDFVRQGSVAVVFAQDVGQGGDLSLPKPLGSRGDFGPNLLAVVARRHELHHQLPPARINGPSPQRAYV